MNISKEISEWEEQCVELCQRALQLIDENNFSKLEKILDIYFNLFRNCQDFLDKNEKLYTKYPELKQSGIKNQLLKDVEFIKNYCKYQEAKDVVDKFFDKINNG